MIFKGLSNIRKLLIYLRHLVAQMGNRLRRPDARNNVFTLCVHQVFAIELLFACGGVSRESNAGAAIVTHISEYHCLYVNRRTPACRDIIHAAIYDCPRVVPRTEHSRYGFKQLFLCILREFLAHFLLIDFFVFLDEVFQIIRIQFRVHLDAFCVFGSLELFFKFFFVDAHNNVGEHLDESPVAVIRPTRIAGLLRHTLNRNVIEAEVQDRVHHTRHGSAGAAAYGYEERIFLVAELLAGNLFRLRHCIINLLHYFVGDLFAVFIVLRASFRRNRKALGNRQTKVGHLCQVCAFAPKKVSHGSVTFFEKVYILFCHLKLLLNLYLFKNFYLFAYCSYHEKPRLLYMNKCKKTTKDYTFTKIFRGNISLFSGALPSCFPNTGS
ncbi:MAG: hypothetical protein DELT_03107 [Desulfovibrio sp.]